MMNFLSFYRKTFNIENVRQWLHLLRCLHVEQPATAISRCPMLLNRRVGHSTEKAQAVTQWMSTRGLTPDQIVNVIAKWPYVLMIPPTNAVAVTVWLHAELHATDAMIAALLVRCPRVFGLRPSNLASKVSWFKLSGFSDEEARKVVFKQPAVLTCTPARNASQMSALQSFGLSQTQSKTLIVKMPSVICLDLTNGYQQAKVRFLTQEMGRSILELETCAAYLTLSLVDRIGPRWAFLKLHCPDQLQNNLSGIYRETDVQFTKVLVSASLERKCLSSGLTRVEVYHEFRAGWQRGEGALFVLEKKREKKKRSKQGIEEFSDSSEESASPDALAADSVTEESTS